MSNLIVFIGAVDVLLISLICVYASVFLLSACLISMENILDGKQCGDFGRFSWYGCSWHGRPGHSKCNMAGRTRPKLCNQSLPTPL